MNFDAFKTSTVDLWDNTRVTLHNLRVRLRPASVDYVILGLGGSLPEYIPSPPKWHKWIPVDLGLTPGGPSLTGLRYIFDQIVEDPRPLGVLVQNYGLDVGWATAQSVRDLFSRFRARGKKVVFYSPSFDILDYYVATAADAIIIPPPGLWAVIGLRSELTFIKDTLNTYGIRAEVVNVSPYKTAWDTYARSDISPEHRDMLTWLMDGRYEAVVEAIASARKLDPARVRELIDSGPLNAQAAREAGLVDAVLYEDGLAEYLATPAQKVAKAKPKWQPPFAKKTESGPPPKPTAKLQRWGAVRASLRRPIRWRSGKYVGIIPLEGTIVLGRSQSLPIQLPFPIPFFSNQLAGSETIVQHFRDAEKDNEIAAIVLYVNSRGGSALASDLIWHEVERVRRKKPVVVYMGDYAASGGYFVSAGAQWIMAQPLTTTGSIGVISLKVVTAGLYEMFKANRVILQRGARASMFADDAPFSPEDRASAQAQIDHYYADFKNVVMNGRKMDEPTLEEVAGGRVWLGRQALGHKLVDALGDLNDAVEKAKELAKLPANRFTPNAWYSGSGGNLLPPPFPSQVASFIAAIQTALRETAWMIDPVEIKIR
ncbi:MAG: signal peptide peptidase SppA [Chloroflexi bacterium]|nr:signal peptide peptidase SppA [Chloroflexota bacterium]